MRDRLISVAVPVPALGLLTYAIPGGVPMPPIGARVVVPVGPRTLTGVMVGEVAAADTSYTIKPIKSLVDNLAFVPGDVVKLTQWVSEYYMAGPGATLSAAIWKSCSRQKPQRRIQSMSASSLSHCKINRQLLPPAAVCILSLLQRVPSLKCLTTSRQLLDIAGERAFLVWPLRSANSQLFSP